MTSIDINGASKREAVYQASLIFEKSTRPPNNEINIKQLITEIFAHTVLLI